MKVFVVLDTDMNFVYGVYDSINKVMSAAIDLMQEADYRSFFFTKFDDNEAALTFPSDDPHCVGHWTITRHDLEE